MAAAVGVDPDGIRTLRKKIPGAVEATRSNIKKSPRCPGFTPLPWA